MTGAQVSLPGRAWAVLSRPSTDDLASFPLDLEFDGRECRLAIDRSGFRHLLIPCIDEQPEIDPRPAVLAATTRRLSFGGLVAIYLDISCTDNDLRPEFDEVVLDILELVEGSSRPASAAAEALARWRRLFRSRLVRGLSIEAKIGLYAELCLLSALVEADRGFPVDAWRGPMREPHDFELEGRCIEVKGVGDHSDSFTVHGLDQLDTHHGRPLDIAVVTVVGDPDGATVSDLVSVLRGSVSSPAIFASRLLAAGWTDEIADTDRFAVGPVFGVPVSPDTPRLVAATLVESQLPEGISALRYGVEISSILPYAGSASLAEIVAQAAL